LWLTPPTCLSLRVKRPSIQVTYNWLIFSVCIPDFEYCNKHAFLSYAVHCVARFTKLRTYLNVIMVWKLLQACGLPICDLSMYDQRYQLGLEFLGLHGTNLKNAPYKKSKSSNHWYILGISRRCP
jgi:hypothetical protein